MQPLLHYHFIIVCQESHSAVLKIRVPHEQSYVFLYQFKKLISFKIFLKAYYIILSIKEYTLLKGIILK